MFSLGSLGSIESLYNTIKVYKNKQYAFKIPSGLTCTKCSNILLNATQTNCGCRYCQDCINGYLTEQTKKCLSNDCGDIETVVPDRAVNKEIGKLDVKCIYDGCNHRDLLKDIGDHLEKCEYQTIICDKCQEDCAKMKLEDHQLNKCKMRQVQCPDCKESMDFSKFNDVHLNIYKDQLCSKYVGPCPYKCGMKENVNVKNHRKLCPKKPFPCPFSEIGCIEILTKETIDSHLSKEGAMHAEFSVQETKKLREETSTLKDLLKSLFAEIDLLKNEQIKLKREIENQESVVRFPSSATGNVKSPDDKVIYKNGVYIWKIERFSQLKTAAERGERISITSDPFYTKEFGYKMSMKIYPAGDGVGKGTHLSVFFTLMKGEYDDLLPWPFKNKVTLTLLDQKNKTSDHSDTFKPDPRSTCYQQPTDEYNIASGSPKFISFNQIFDTYIKDDTIFLKIQVLN